LWNRIGTGYVYSDEFITDEEALSEFKTHLKIIGNDTEKFEYRKLDMKTGSYERIWVKNVVAIGLAAGFIEPLESTGLWTVHQFLIQLVYILKRGVYNQLDRDIFNEHTKKDMHFWLEFVALHYNLSARRDTPYWLNISQKSYKSEYTDLPFALASKFKMKDIHFDFAGMPCILYGMNWLPVNRCAMLDIENPTVDKDDRFEKWNEAVKNLPLMYDYIQNLHED
jgi:tryptophan halogenase